MVGSLNGHLGVAVLQLVVWAYVPEHEIAQTPLHKEVELTVLVPAVTQRAVTYLHVQVS